jgi:hypothetical protein
MKCLNCQAENPDITKLCIESSGRKESHCLIGGALIKDEEM